MLSSQDVHDWIRISINIGDIGLHALSDGEIVIPFEGRCAFAMQDICQKLEDMKVGAYLKDARDVLQTFVESELAAERELTRKLIEAINMVINVREQEATHFGDTQEIRACKAALSLVPADRRIS